MAIQVINIGSSANKGDGDPVRTAFKKINENFAELNTTTTNTVRDMQGSVFGDDSTLLVDAVNSLIPSSVLSGNLPAIDGSALTGITVNSLAFSNITSKPTTVAGYGITDALTSVPAQTFASLTGKPTTLAGYGITDGGGGGAAFTNIGIGADDSTIRTINEGESFLIKGGTGITTASDAEGNITVTGVAQDFTFASLTGTPTTISGYGITDALALGTSASTALAGNTALFDGQYSSLSGKPTIPSTIDDVIQNGNTISSNKLILDGNGYSGDVLEITESGGNNIKFAGTASLSGNGTNFIGGLDFYGNRVTPSNTNLLHASIKSYAKALSGDTDTGIIQFEIYDLADGFNTQTEQLKIDKSGLTIQKGNIAVGGGDVTGVGNIAAGTLNNHTIPGGAAGTIALTSDVLDGDLTGSVFGDDSTLLVDGNNNKIVGAVDTTSLRTSETKIALGSNAGYTTQGQSAVAIGRYAGQTTQGGSAVAIGYFAGLSGQGQFGIAIGNTAGQTTQSTSAVAIGQSAGNATQGQGAVAVGTQAGLTTQGTKAIAIGYRAGETSQAANSIVLNATGLVLNNTVADTFVVKPVREVAGGTLPTGFKTVGYNPTTGEFIYLAGV